jgi:hypothetical protein
MLTWLDHSMMQSPSRSARTPGTPARAMCTHKSAMSALPPGPGGSAIFPTNAPRNLPDERSAPGCGRDLVACDRIFIDYDPDGFIILILGSVLR